MTLPHRKGYKDRAAAERSAAARQPGAEIETGCPCGQVHVNLPPPGRTPLRARQQPPADGR